MNKVLLVVCLVVGGVLRFYNLGVPSMWWDEILVPLTARYPVEYVLKFSQSCEMHPPLFHLVIKAILIFGKSDFVVRFVPAIIGVASIYFIFTVAEKYCGEKSAILAAAILAVNPFHIGISRQVRPYTIIILATIFLMLFLKAYLDKKDTRSLVNLMLVNLFLMCIHYNAVLVVGAELVVVALVDVFEKNNPFAKYNVVLLAGVCLALAVILPFALPYAATHKGIVNAASYGDISGAFINNLSRLFTFWHSPSTPLICMLVFFAGVLVALKSDKKFVVISLSIPGVSLAVLLVMKYGSFFNPWHLSFLLPCVIVTMVRPFEEKYIHKNVVSVVVLALVVLAISNINKSMYALAGTSGVSKQEAMVLNKSELIGQSIFTEPSDINALTWYLNQNSVHNAFTSPEIKGVASERVFLKASEKLYQEVIANDPDLLRVLGMPSVWSIRDGMNIYSWGLEPSEGINVESLPYDSQIQMRPSGYFSTATNARNVVVLGDTLIPVETNKTGIYETSIINQVAKTTFQEITLVAGFSNEGVGNELLFEAWFDNESHIYTQRSCTSDGINDFGIIIARNEPYSKLNLRVSMKVAPITPQYPGGNQGTLKFKNIEISIRSLS